MTFAALPAPSLNRWQPLRSGLLNLYRYDYEEFHFEDGRLLLRGNNGTGKSRILALQLPFLLDGEITPSRVEPDGDIAKRIEWNLLMGRYPERTGYTWIEFGRRLADGTAAYVTLGCGMRAIAGHTGLHSRWLFVTSQRIGRDLFLQNAQRQPHGAPRLTELIGSNGQVFKSAEDYRRAVDMALFGLGPRYPRLLELLIRLRRPQLSRKLEEDELSQTLSDALPTVNTTLIDEVAEAFRGLQADRDSLRGFEATRAGVETFLRDYRVYVRTAIRRRATAIRTAHSAFEEEQRKTRDAQRRLAETESNLAALERNQARLESELAGLEEEVSTLRASPEMRTADEIEQARKTAQMSSDALDAARVDEENAAARSSTAIGRLTRAEEESNKTLSLLENTLSGAAHLAADPGLTDEHIKYVGATTKEIGDAWIRRAEPALSRTIQLRREHVKHVRELELEINRANQAHAKAEDDRIRAADACTEAREEEFTSKRAFEEAAAALLKAYRTWCLGLRELAPTSADALEDSFNIWLEQRDGSSPLREAGEAAHLAAVDRLSAEVSRVKLQIEEIDRIGAALRDEINELERGVSPTPDPTRTRPADRGGRPGAPFWRLCDFRPGISSESRAGIEAALEASGLLDAWVLPDGSVVDPTTEDAFLSDLADDVPTNHLGQWLIAAVDETATSPAVHPGQVERLLQQIGVGRESGSHWVGEDGTWRMGPLTGRWTKPDAAFIGETTRAAARRRRIAELREQLGLRESERAAVNEALAALEGRRISADREAEAMPSDQPVNAAGYQLDQATARVNSTFIAHEVAERFAHEKRALLDSANRTLEKDAGDLRLTQWIGRLHDLEQAISDYAAALKGLWPTARHWMSVAAQLESVRQHADEARTMLHDRSERRQAADETAAAALSRYRTLQETHGAAAATVLAKLAAAEKLVAGQKAALAESRSQQLAQTALHAQARADHDRSVEERARHEDLRHVAIEHLQSAAAERLLAEAHSDLTHVERPPWTTTRAVEISRQIEPLLSDTASDEDSWRRRQNTIYNHVQELRDRLIAQGHQPETQQLEDIVLVRCLFQGQLNTMTELTDALETEINERQHLFAAREQEIIENHLLGEIAVELQRLIRDAESWISTANRELAARPTSTGMRFRFAWEAEPEGAFASVRKAFLRTSELWTPSERTELTRFLQERIRAEQMANEDGSWRDHLSGALDYRRWHRFVVERQQENVWRRLDKRTYGTGSGGEKALALTLPRFAAAAAHYRGASEKAPRLVMLDEVFAGIDPTMRAQCMGVLTQFDLDVVMTSENEWGCYPTVPGLGIYHLTAVPGIDAVAATHWIWNGTERRKVDIQQLAAVAPDDSPSTSTDDT